MALPWFCLDGRGVGSHFIGIERGLPRKANMEIPPESKPARGNPFDPRTVVRLKKDRMIA